MRRFKVRRSIPATATAIVMATTAASAQPQQQAQVGGVEEIVVTARQRSETLQEIPLAIAAFSAADIEKAGFRDLGDIALQSSGIQFNPNMSGATPGRFNSVIRIRGVNVQSPLPHLQATSLFVDGVYSLGGAQVLPITDLERVEIIKGPQSAFFGRNTFAGAINYITKKPNIDEYEGRVDFSGATYNTFESNVQHTGPIVPGKLGYLANVRLMHRGAQWTATDGGKMGKQASESASLALYAEPTDNWDIKLRGFYQEDDDGPAAEGFFRTRAALGFGFDTCTGKTYPGVVPTVGAVAGAVPGTQVTISPRNYICGAIPEFGDNANIKITSNTSLRPAIFSRVRPQFNGEAGNTVSAPQASPDFLIQQLVQRKFIPGVPTIDHFGMARWTKRFSLNSNYEFGGGYMATLTAGYNKTASNWIVDFDHTDIESWWSQDPQTGKDKSAELRIVSPGEDRFRWVAGATYYKQTFVTSGAGGLAISACAADPTCAIGPGNFGLPATSGDKAKVWAGYGSLSYDITQELTLDLEFRYMQDQRTNTQSQGAGFRDFTEKYKQKTPRIILTYKPTDELTVYGQASRGTLPGVINGLVSICSNDTFLQPYTSPITGLPSTASECAQIASQSPTGDLIPSTPAQYLDAAEIGIKSSWLEGTLNVNLTGYYYKWKNLPFGLTIRYVRDADNPALRDRLPNAFPNSLGIQTSGSAKFKGGELEMQWAANENWDFTSNISYNDNKFSELLVTGAFSTEIRNPVVNGVRPTNPNIVSAANNYAGSRQTRYPKWQGNLSTTYTDKFVGDWDWFARADAIYFGRAYVDLANYAWVRPYWMVHTRAGVEKENLRVEFFIRNLFDEDTWSGAQASTDFGVQGDLSFSAQGIGVAPQDKRQFGLRVNYTF